MLKHVVAIKTDSVEVCADTVDHLLNSMPGYLEDYARLLTEPVTFDFGDGFSHPAVRAFKSCAGLDVPDGADLKVGNVWQWGARPLHVPIVPSRIGIRYRSLTEDDLHLYYNPEADDVRPWTCVTYNSVTKVLMDQFGRQQTMRGQALLASMERGF